MAGVDPALLHKGPNQAYPGSPPNPVARTPPAPPPAPGHGADTPPAEPVALHEAAQQACEHLKAARAAMEDLQGQAQLADGIDAPTEKMIDDAASAVGTLADSFDKIEQTLGAARKEHEDAMGEFGDEATPGPE